MNDRLKTIIDLEKYPIHNLDSPVIKELIQKCKLQLESIVALQFLTLFYQSP